MHILDLNLLIDSAYIEYMVLISCFDDSHSFCSLWSKICPEVESWDRVSVHDWDFLEGDNVKDEYGQSV